MIDNYDSFTYNLVHYFSELNENVQVFQNDRVTLADIKDMQPARIVISPGPCTPDEGGISLDIIKNFQGKIHILGVCLGHQCVGQAYGGRVVHARRVMHGKTSEIHHNNTDIFKGLANPFTATRYHSLVVERASLPDELEVTAWTQSGDGDIDEIMGLRHKEHLVYGVQFHPESILTEHGHDLLKNFLELTA